MRETMNTADKEKFWKNYVKAARTLCPQMSEKELAKLAEEVIWKRLGPKSEREEGANEGASSGFTVKFQAGYLSYKYEND